MGKLVGNPPNVFDGNCRMTMTFGDQFINWWRQNPNTFSLGQPYQRILMALSYMRGPSVSDWARDKGTWAFNQVYGAQQRNPNEIGLWTEFEQSFNNTFLDTTKVEEATRSLDALRMTGTNLEDYNAQFPIY